MRYSYDDQYNVLMKSSTNLSASNSCLSTDLAAIDYFQFEFNEIQLHNCWKLVHHTRVNETFIPQSTDVTRLENLSWRRWTKLKYRLSEVSPESVDWFKDCDITWLYGPLVSSVSHKEDFGFQSPVDIPHSPFPSGLNDSVSSLSSTTSSLESSPFYSDTSDEEDDDEDYMGCLSEKLVKPILKHRYSYGPLDHIDRLRLRKTKTPEAEPFKKSVSFAAMVQIRQF